MNLAESRLPYFTLSSCFTTPLLYQTTEGNGVLEMIWCSNRSQSNVLHESFQDDKSFKTKWQTVGYWLIGGKRVICRSVEDFLLVGARMASIFMMSVGEQHWGKNYFHHETTLGINNVCTASLLDDMYNRQVGLKAKQVFSIELT